MKGFVISLVLCVGSVAVFAGTKKPSKSSQPSPTVAVPETHGQAAPVAASTDETGQLKLQLAQKDLQLAQMNRTIVQLQVQLRLLERAALGTTGEDAVNVASQGVDEAQRRVNDAKAALEKKK